MAASIEDVAKRAKVSISTVSRVLNRRSLVNPKTRRRVEEAIAELNYRPNVFARGLMLRKSELLGLVLPSRDGLGLPRVCPQGRPRTGVQQPRCLLLRLQLRLPVLPELFPQELQWAESTASWGDRQSR